jgi:hypothetical protein
MNINCVAVILVSVIFQAVSALASTPAPIKAPEGWQTSSPREEIRPAFSSSQAAVIAAAAPLSFSTTRAKDLMVRGRKRFQVQGGHFYRFEVFRKTDAWTRRAAARWFGCSGAM